MNSGTWRHTGQLILSWPALLYCCYICRLFPFPSLFSFSGSAKARRLPCSVALQVGPYSVLVVCLRSAGVCLYHSTRLRSAFRIHSTVRSHIYTQCKSGPDFNGGYTKKNSTFIPKSRCIFLRYFQFALFNVCVKKFSLDLLPDWPNSCGQWQQGFFLLVASDLLQLVCRPAWLVDQKHIVPNRISREREKKSGGCFEGIGPMSRCA